MVNMGSDTASVVEKNEDFFNREYSRVDVRDIVAMLHRRDAFLDNATRMHISWVGLYHGDFRNELKGKRVLELGCGDCGNAALMAALGAEVYANDIASVCGNIIKGLNESYPFEIPIRFVEGDFMKFDFPDDSFDIVVGKSFVHHLTNEQEVAFTEKIARILKDDGMVRYFEPAVNSRILDELRWMIPVKGRPSKLQREKFRAWKEEDVHPERDNSAAGYRRMGRRFFHDVKIVNLGCLDRFERFLPAGPFKGKFRVFAFRAEKWLPGFIRNPLARGQSVTYRRPIRPQE